MIYDLLYRGMYVLNTASRNAQGVRLWIKADGVDVVKESVKGEWSGDVDMNDASVSKLFSAFSRIPTSDGSHWQNWTRGSVRSTVHRSRSH